MKIVSNILKKAKGRKFEKERIQFNDLIILVIQKKKIWENFIKIQGGCGAFVKFVAWHHNHKALIKCYQVKHFLKLEFNSYLMV